jgi:hypothetical protein
MAKHQKAKPAVAGRATRRPRLKGSVKSKVQAARARSHTDLVQKAEQVYRGIFDLARVTFNANVVGERTDALARQEANRAATRAVYDLLKE